MGKTIKNTMERTLRGAHVFFTWYQETARNTRKKTERKPFFLERKLNVVDKWARLKPPPIWLA